MLLTLVPNLWMVVAGLALCCTGVFVALVIFVQLLTIAITLFGCTDPALDRGPHPERDPVLEAATSFE